MKHDARLARLERRRTLADQDDTLHVRIVDYDGSVLASYQLPAQGGNVDYRKGLFQVTGDATEQLTFGDVPIDGD